MAGHPFQLEGLLAGVFSLPLSPSLSLSLPLLLSLSFFCFFSLSISLLFFYLSKGVCYVDHPILCKHHLGIAKGDRCLGEGDDLQKAPRLPGSGAKTRRESLGESQEISLAPAQKRGCTGANGARTGVKDLTSFRKPLQSPPTHRVPKPHQQQKRKSKNPKIFENS